jgi:hypothetical protein
MCDPKNTEIFEKYEGCGHRLPKEACDYYCNQFGKCFASYAVAKDVSCHSWEKGECYTGLCPFCQQGKDISGAYKYGKRWSDRQFFK